MRGIVWSTDAWANPEGWDCNQKIWVGDVELPDDTENEDIIDALYEREFIRTKNMDLFEIEDYFNGSAWCVEVRNAETGEPLYEVEFDLEV